MSVTGPHTRTEAEVLDREAVHIPPRESDTEECRREDDSHERVTLTPVSYTHLTLPTKA